MPRLVQCSTCKILEKLPDFSGPVGDDVLLEVWAEKHLGHVGQMFSVDQATWDNLDQRTKIEEDIWKNQAEFSATRDTYEEDALVCFNRHNRPKMGCIDYCEDSKRIGSPTKSKSRYLKPVYLCFFCPVHSGFVATEQRHKRGMYK